MTYAAVTADELVQDLNFPEAATRPITKGRWQREGERDTAALPGDAVGPASLHRYRDERTLGSLLVTFEEYGLESPSGTLFRLTQPAAETGRRFLARLSRDKKLPRISPDEDGNLVMVWQQEAGSLIVVIDGLNINAISAAATPEAEYLAPLPYEGDTIPQQVLDRIPA